MGSLNESQARFVRSTIQAVADILRKIEALTRVDESPFSRERPDLSSEEARLLLAFVNLARRRLLDALDRLGIERPERSLSSRRSVTTALASAGIALSELSGRKLRGYGDVDPEAAEELTALSADLEALMQRGAALLRESEDGGLATTVASLTGPPGEILRRLLALSTERGLTELRPLIAAAAERAGSTILDVGVFGRLSSGKSSLINALVGEPVLPVGATPVTSVPLRISRGSRSARVHFRSEPAREIAVDDLPAFATESENPQNVRGVSSMEVTVPAAPEGLRFLDTPGVGSLSLAGSAQAFAWLPRCDFGLILLPAGAPVGRDEVALVSGLLHAGIRCCVLLSKSDLLEDSDLSQVLAHVESELRPIVGSRERIETRPVSIRPRARAGFDAFRREVLDPLASAHRAKAVEALRARLHRLLRLADASPEGGTPALESVDLDAGKRKVAAGESIATIAQSLAGSAEAVLDRAAEAVVESWRRGEAGGVPARHAIASAAAHALSAVRDAVDGVHTDSPDGDEVRSRRLPPLFDPAFLGDIRPLPLPRIVPPPLLRSSARRALAPLRVPLEKALERFASRLRAWGEGELAGIRAGGAGPRSDGIRDPELARLEALIGKLEPSTSPTEREG